MKGYAVAAVAFFCVAGLIGCGTVMAFSDEALTGYDNPMDTRDSFEKDLNKPDILGEGQITGGGQDQLIQDDIGQQGQPQKAPKQ